jgi:hypothetical protein
MSNTTESMTDAQIVLEAYERTWAQGHGSPLAAALRAIANLPNSVPIHVQDESYWPYVNGLEAMANRLDAIASELEVN